MALHVHCWFGTFSLIHRYITAALKCSNAADMLINYTIIAKMFLMTFNDTSKFNIWQQTKKKKKSGTFLKHLVKALTKCLIGLFYCKKSTGVSTHSHTAQFPE